jgi:hypothetical protein
MPIHISKVYQQHLRTSEMQQSSIPFGYANHEYIQTGSLVCRRAVKCRKHVPVDLYGSWLLVPEIKANERHDNQCYLCGKVTKSAGITYITFAGTYNTARIDENKT